MGRMLINDDQSRPQFRSGFTENIRTVELANYPEPVGGYYLLIAVPVGVVPDGSACFPWVKTNRVG